jgi:phosphoribosylaminoimidazolecarboxamide formyltransferase/IMP cyclohydrolase
MKHENMCGGAVRQDRESLRELYIRARDCDYQAALGAVVGFNAAVDTETADEIMHTFIECVAAPEFEKGALTIFNSGERYNLNRDIRVVQIDPYRMKQLPKFREDAHAEQAAELKRLPDGTIIRSDPYTSGIRSVDDMLQYTVTGRKPMSHEARDLLTAWRFCIGLRSNASVFVKDGYVRGAGTGFYDRVSSIEHPAEKNRRLHGTLEGAKRSAVDFELDDSVLATDGFLPKRDGFDAAVKAGASAIILPEGGLEREQKEILDAANATGVAMVRLPAKERCFSHK